MTRIFELNNLEENSYSNALKSTLLHLLKVNDIDRFTQTISHDPSTVNHFYRENSENGTLLDIACRSPGNSAFASILLQSGASVNLLNTVTGKAPIHETVQNSDIDTLRVLLQHPDCKVNIVDSKGNTALEYAGQYDKIDLLDILIASGANKSHRQDKASIIAIPIAPKPQKGTIGGVNLAVRKLKTLSSVEDDKEMYIKGDSIGEFIKRQYPKDAKEMQKSSTIYTPIMKAARYGHWRTFEKLWSDEHITIEPVAGKTVLHAVLDGILAAKYKECPARIFMENLVAGKRKRDSINDAYFPPEQFSLFDDETPDHHRCLQYILDNIAPTKLDINFADDSGNTALHYAVAWKENRVTKALLRAGAYTCKANKSGMIPLRSISSQMLEQYLDSCISSNEYPPEHSDFRITFDYKMFLSPIKQDASSRNDKNTGGIDYGCGKVRDQSLRESEPILVMNDAPRLRKLLIHPLIRSYLNLKWRIIKKYFYYNFILYFIYWALLSSYLFYIFSNSSPSFSSSSQNTTTNCTIDMPPRSGNHSVVNFTQPIANYSANPSQSDIFDNQSHQIHDKFTNPGDDVVGTLAQQLINGSNHTHYDAHQSIIDVPWRVVILICCSILILREAFQAYVLPQSYLKSAENWLELGMFLMTFALLIFYINSSRRASLSAIVILASWMELILLMGRHPFFSTHVEMFKTVSLNFLKFLLLYSIMIIAFAFSFYILFKDKTDDDDQPTIFRHFSISIFKTLVMLTGEFDASTIPFGDQFSIGHVFFVLFLFFIAIVLFNLLSGLAVGDTQLIRNDAEIVGIVSRIKFIAYVETMAVGDPIQCLDFVDKLLLCFCCCFFWSTKKKHDVRLEKVDDSMAIAYRNRNTLETFHKRISLSYRLPNSKIETFPNRSHFTWKSFDPQIIDDAVNVLRKSKPSDEINNHAECSRQIQEYKSKLEKLENLLYCKRIAELKLLRALTTKFSSSNGRKVAKKKPKLTNGKLKST